MEKVFASPKLGSSWQTEIRSRRKQMWWFDLDEYESDMKIDGISPIVCSDEPVDETECWQYLFGSTCMLLLRSGTKRVAAVVHEKSGGLRFYSQHKSSFTNSRAIQEDAPGVFLTTVAWKTYAQQGLVKIAKKYLSGGFKAEAVFVDPRLETLVDWGVAWVVERSLERLSRKRVQDILKGGK